MPNHTVTDKIDGKTITNVEFYEQARRWAAIVRNKAKRNALAFSKGKQKPHTYKQGKKAGKLERKLASSIQFNIEHDLHIPECVSFKIPFTAYTGNGPWATDSRERRANTSIPIRGSAVQWLTGLTSPSAAMPTNSLTSPQSFTATKCWPTFSVRKKLKLI